MEDWRDDAACLNDWAPFDATEPEGRLKSGERGRLEAIAKSICYSCKVKTDCTADMIRTETPSQMFHVRAGLTADERRDMYNRRIRRSRRDKAKETAA
jgi:hypothetical protein